MLKLGSITASIRSVLILLDYFIFFIDTFIVNTYTLLKIVQPQSNFNHHQFQHKTSITLLQKLAGKHRQQVPTRFRLLANLLEYPYPFSPSLSLFLSFLFRIIR